MAKWEKASYAKCSCGKEFFGCHHCWVGKTVWCKDCGNYYGPVIAAAIKYNDWFRIGKPTIRIIEKGT